jgi:hypothetical protein
MSDTRRTFFQAAAAAAALGRAGAFASQEQPAPAGAQVPKMKFGKVEISRLVVGCNCFYGYAHYNQTLSVLMADYYTPDRVLEVLHQAQRFGLNAYNFLTNTRSIQDLDRFLAEKGSMHLILQGQGDQTAFLAKYKPLATYHQGEVTDRAFASGSMNSVKEWCKKHRDLGLMVGVGTHKPEVIAEVESQGWDVDFYAGCVYNRTRSREEWQKALGGELVEMQGECYLQSDPPRMYKVMRATPKPCFAFKILAAGRIANAEQAFRLAYDSIKPVDGVFIGLFPVARDEVRENAERVCRLLAGPRA